MKLTAQMARIDAANNNVGNAISFNQTQDGYLQQISDALNRMSELSILSQDVTKSTSDKALLMGWRWASRLMAPATQMMPKTMKSTW